MLSRYLAVFKYTTRAMALGALWVLGAGASFALVLGQPGGDSLANLADHTALRAEDGHLFVGGEFLGHLWFVPWGAGEPADRGAPLLMAARLAGWVGWAGMLLCAAALVAPVRGAVDRGALAAVTCGAPYTLLLAGYPQSTALMSALVPLYLAASLAASRGGRSPGLLAVAGGGLLALACTAHGAAYWLGAGVVALLAGWARRGERRSAVLFGLSFLVLWAGITAAEWSLIHRSRTMPWSFLSRAFDLAGFADSFGGPLDLSRPLHPASLAALAAELWRWSASVVPLLPLAAVSAPLLWWRGRRTQASGLGFLALSAGGALLLWACWNTWYGYPADWDVTAVAALTVQLALVSWLVQAGPSPWRQALLGCAVPLQLTMAIELGARFTGWPG